MFGGTGPQRHDQAHLLSHVLQLPLPALAHLLEQVRAQLPSRRSSMFLGCLLCLFTQGVAQSAPQKMLLCETRQS